MDKYVIKEKEMENYVNMRISDPEKVLKVTVSNKTKE